MNLYREAKKLNPLHTLTSGDIKNSDSALLTEEVEMELIGHFKQPKGWQKVNSKWTKKEKTDKRADVLYSETVKTLSQPDINCPVCGGRGHKGYLTRSNKGQDTSGFILCKCVLK